MDAGATYIRSRLSFPGTATETQLHTIWLTQVCNEQLTNWSWTLFLDSLLPSMLLKILKANFISYGDLMLALTRKPNGTQLFQNMTYVRSGTLRLSETNTSIQ